MIDVGDEGLLVEEGVAAILPFAIKVRRRRRAWIQYPRETMTNVGSGERRIVLMRWRRRGIEERSRGLRRRRLMRNMVAFVRGRLRGGFRSTAAAIELSSVYRASAVT